MHCKHALKSIQNCLWIFHKLLLPVISCLTQQLHNLLLLPVFHLHIKFCRNTKGCRGKGYSSPALGQGRHAQFLVESKQSVRIPVPMPKGRLLSLLVRPVWLLKAETTRYHSSEHSVKNSKWNSVQKPRVQKTTKLVRNYANKSTNLQFCISTLSFRYLHNFIPVSRAFKVLILTTFPGTK